MGGTTMNRTMLYHAWWTAYRGLPRTAAISAIRGRIIFIEGRMRKMARLPGGKSHRGIPNYTLQTALGMSLGVHKQLLAGLHPAPREE